MSPRSSPKRRLDISDFCCWIQPIRLPPGDFCLAILAHKLSYHNRLVQKSKIENLKAVQWESLKKLVSVRDVFVIQPTGLGVSAFLSWADGI